MCGEHCVDCSCPEKPDRCTPTSLRDACNVIDNLLTCLTIILMNDEYQAYHKQPHLDLVMDIQSKIGFIERGLQEI